MLTGLMTTLLSAMRSMWHQQSDAEAARRFQDFLENAATNRVLSTLTIIPIVSVIVIALIGAPSHAKYICALVGGGVFLLFVLATTPSYRASGIG